jgi:cell division transport system permease protein
MGLYGLELIVEEVIMNLKRDRVITLATMGIVALAISVLGALTLFLLNLNLWTERIASELKVNVYLKAEVPRARARALRREMAQWPNVTSARLITKEEGWEKVRKTYPVGTRLGNFPNPLTDAIEIRTASEKDIPSVSRTLAKLGETKSIVPNPEEVKAPGGKTQKIIRLRNIVRLVAFIIIGAMALISFIIVHNTARLSLFARRREIAIMQLVGATPRFVAAPFLAEGALHGFIGSLIACCILIPLHMYLRALAVSSGGTILQLLPDEQMLPISAALIGCGVLLGIAGAGLSLRRFLGHHLEQEGH